MTKEIRKYRKKSKQKRLKIIYYKKPVTYKKCTHGEIDGIKA